MQVTILILSAVLLAMLIASVLGPGRPAERGTFRRRDGGSGRSASVGEGNRTCPLCGSLLERGRNVHTHVYRGGGDTLAHIFGCPSCWPQNNRTATRTCPVCRGTLDPDGYLVARMFEKGPRTHVHVLGCTRCRKGRSRPAD